MNLSKLLTAFLLVASCEAFMGPLVCQKAPLTIQSLMSQDETEKLVQHALDCSEGECSVEEVDDLVVMLKDQQKELTARIGKLDTLIKSLKVVNDKSGRKVDEVKETVRAIFRVFSAVDHEHHYPSGFSGDVPKKGSRTAYDVLNPRKWKSSP